MTDLEKRLIDVLGRMVQQHLSLDHLGKDVYWTDFIAINKEALMLLTELGVMEDVLPEKKFAERWERLFYARFVENWVWKLYRDQLIQAPSEAT